MTTTKRKPTTAELLDRAIAAYLLAASQPVDSPSAYAVGRRYASARMRYANAYGMSERDADVLVQRMAARGDN